MNTEIIVPRKKSTSLGAALLLFFAAAAMIFIIVGHFIDFFDEENVLLVLGAVAVAPICIGCGVFYFKQIFNEEPVLTVNEQGITDSFRKSSVGFISWEDIAGVSIVPYYYNVFICVFLKNPEKYAHKSKAVARMIGRQPRTPNLGHIQIATEYFKKELNAVSGVIEYYLGLCNSGIDTKTHSF